MAAKPQTGNREPPRAERPSSYSVCPRAEPHEGALAASGPVERALPRGGPPRSIARSRDLLSRSVGSDGRPQTPSPRFRCARTSPALWDRQRRDGHRHRRDHRHGPARERRPRIVALAPSPEREPEHGISGRVGERADSSLSRGQQSAEEEKGSVASTPCRVAGAAAGWRDANGSRSERARRTPGKKWRCACLIGAGIQGSLEADLHYTSVRSGAYLFRTSDILTQRAEPARLAQYACT